jgi:hypothetical protein
MIADETTRDALLAFKGELSTRATARRLGVLSSTVNDVIHRNAMSLKRENPLRIALGLEPLTDERVTLKSSQRVVAKPGYGKKRGYVEFKIRVSPEEAEIIREMLDVAGYRSFSEWWRESKQLAQMAWQADLQNLV